MSADFHLYYKGGEEVLKQMAANMVNDIARKVEAAAGDEAEMESYTTDRAAASIRVPAHLQAKDGVLTRAAASVGLEVHQK